MNIFDQISSNSQEESNPDDFGNLLKKVNGSFNDSDNSESSSLQKKDKMKRKNYSKRISSLLKIEQNEVERTSNIKKNCISAKKSRQRKKKYIEVLELTARTLKEEILQRKNKIAANRDAIMNILKETNPEKSKFIESSLSDSKQLVEEATKPDHGPNAKDRAKLEFMINSYLYKFGFTGVLRKDVIEQLKAKFCEYMIDERLLINGKEPEIRKVLKQFQECTKAIEDKSADLEFIIRKLQSKLTQEETVRFLIDQAFFDAKEQAMPPEINLSVFKEEQAEEL